MPRAAAPIEDLQHPSWYAVKRGCRCEPCLDLRRTYNTAYQRDRRARQKAAHTTT